MRELLAFSLVLSLTTWAAWADDPAPDGVRLSEIARGTAVFITYDHTDNATGEVRTAMGSGFLIRNDGTVLTAWHNLEEWFSQNEAEQSKHPIMGRVGSINSGVKVELSYIAGDTDTDMALLGFRDGRTDYRALPLCSEAQIGANILAFGFPLGRELTPFPGKIANFDGPGRRWTANDNFEKGASGGPVFDAKGRVIGLVYGGFGSVSAVRYITPISWAGIYLPRVGVRETCGVTPQPPSPVPDPPPPIPVPPNPAFSIDWSSIDILYWERAADRGRVLSALQTLKIIPRVNRSSAPVSSELLSCTPDVPLAAVKALASALVSAGVQLRSITINRTPGYVRKMIIETVGTETLAGDPAFPLVSRADIERMTSCSVHPLPDGNWGPP